MTFYEFMENCQEQELSADEAISEWYDYCNEKHRRFEEEYYSDPMVCAGWAQQDVIDMYRMER